MRKIKLKEVAEIAISNVDKKTYEGQKSVRLCNFTDVYYNWAITKEYSTNLMNSTASDSELNKFILHKGDVCITKDSETKDDIGQSTYIADEINQMVLGYHCALIRPKVEFVLGKYINSYLHTKYATKFFELNASGSGQRYTLTLNILEDFQMFVPEIDIQRKIVELLSNIDRKIEVNKLINDNLQQICQIMFLEYFANKNPNGIIKDLLNEASKSQVQVNQTDNISGNYPFFTSGESIKEWKDYFVDGINIFLSTGGNATASIYSGKAAYSTDTWCINGKNESTNYLYYYIKNVLSKINDWHFTGSGIKHLQKDSFSQIKIYLPTKNELDFFNSIADNSINIISKNLNENNRLIKLRNVLLPLLMNGQATIIE